MRILVHAGFHKTGTTTVQRTLRTNRPALKSRLVIALPWKLRPLLHAARAYSVYGDPLALAKFTHRAENFVAELPPLSRRDLILCSEELSGHLPGRGGIPDYRATVPLMQELTQALLRRYPEADLSVVYSTRKPERWLESAFWEQVKSSNQTLSLVAFCKQYADAADFGSVLDQIRASIAPARVKTFSLEDCSTARLGPAEPLLTLAGIPQSTLAELTLVEPANTRLPQKVLDHLLLLNRTIEDSPSRTAAKRAYLDSLTG